MAEHDQMGNKPESTLENYTGTELPYRALYITGIALFVTAVVFAVALVPLRDAFIAGTDRQSEGELVPDNTRPGGALLQQSPEGDWQVWENLMADKLSSYGWQDKAAGIAHIPVERAIELALAERLVQSTPDAEPAQIFGALASPGHGGGGGHGAADTNQDDSHQEDSSH